MRISCNRLGNNCQVRGLPLLQAGCLLWSRMVLWPELLLLQTGLMLQAVAPEHEEFQAASYTWLLRLCQIIVCTQWMVWMAAAMSHTAFRTD